MDHSERSASSGSTFIARHAGNHDAAAVTSTNTVAARTKLSGSSGQAKPRYRSALVTNLALSNKLESDE